MTFTSDHAGSGPAKHRRLPLAILGAGLTAGVLDILDPIVVFWFRGVSPMTILQSVATGLLGRDAYKGGAETALLGLGAHMAIMLVIAAIYLLASRRVAVLAQRPFICGPVYGLIVYIAMNYAVVPLSNAGMKPPAGIMILNQLFAHLVLVGIPIALWARWAAREAREAREA